MKYGEKFRDNRLSSTVVATVPSPITVRPLADTVDPYQCKGALSPLLCRAVALSLTLDQGESAPYTVLPYLIVKEKIIIKHK
jgi:hypothetical protein